jgi:hypothetical protein
MVRRCATVLGLVAGFACRPEPGAEFKGRWMVDGPAFEPCGISERWWPVFDSSLATATTVETTMVFIATPSDSAAARASDVPQLPPPMFATVRGETSGVGAHGPSGGYQRQILVHHFDCAGPFKPADCR